MRGNPSSSYLTEPQLISEIMHVGEPERGTSESWLSPHMTYTVST